METKYLPFENEVKRIDEEISELIKYGKQKGINYSEDIEKKKSEKIVLLKDIYSNLSAWETVQVARHPQRPIFGDYLGYIVRDFREMHGDRTYGDDRALIGGMGRIGREKFMIIGQDKGRSMKEKVACNFGCPDPEGYRKAYRLMSFAEKYGLPILTLIDTPGAHPGIGAEERGQAQAIAENLKLMSRLKTPIISIVIGEGGSGGALGIGVADRLAMMKNSYYSVISPEGCAAILWKDSSKKEEAAEALKLTSKDNYRLGTIDSVIEEPFWGAHRNPREAIWNVGQYIGRTIRDLKKINLDNLVEQRYEKLMSIGRD